MTNKSSLTDEQVEFLAVAEIPLNNGVVAIIDGEDYPRLERYKWSIHVNGYAQAWDKVNKTSVLMHRLILDAPKGTLVDHANKNKLDNRKVNIRLCSRSFNMANQTKSRGQSKYKGVHWHPKAKKWQAQIMVDKTVLYLGLFPQEIEAAKAYNNAATKHFGDFARLNEIPLPILEVLKNG